MANFEIARLDNYGGDDEERKAWRELAAIFPHYETLWANVIVPLTERPVSQSLRRDLPIAWRRFAENHYSIFLHLAAASDRAKRCHEQLLAFEDVFAHLGTMLDLVEDLLFTADWILQGVEPQIEVQTTEALSRYLAEWATLKEGEKYLRRMKERGRPFPVTLFQEHHKQIFLRVAPHHKDLWGKYHQMREELRNSRNIFMHRALTAKLRMEGDHRVLAPKDPAKYPDWHTVHQVGAQYSVVATDFFEVGALAHATIDAVAATIESLWEAVWEDSGTQLVQKLPARPQVYGSLKPLVYDRFTSTSSASAVAIVYPSTK